MFKNEGSNYGECIIKHQYGVWFESDYSKITFVNLFQQLIMSRAILREKYEMID